MIYKIDYSKDATKVIKKWKKSNRPLFEKLRSDGIRFTKVYTDASAAVALRRLFEGR